MLKIVSFIYYVVSIYLDIDKKLVFKKEEVSKMKVWTSGRKLNEVTPRNY